MSVRVMGLVWGSDIPTTLKIVLLAYADAANHDGTDIWPGHQRVTSMTSLSSRAVYNATTDLLESGVLIQEQRGQKGQRASFRINTTHQMLSPHPDPPVDGDQDKPSGCTSRTLKSEVEGAGVESQGAPQSLQGAPQSLQGAPQSLQGAPHDTPSVLNRPEPSRTVLKKRTSLSEDTTPDHEQRSTEETMEGELTLIGGTDLDDTATQEESKTRSRRRDLLWEAFVFVHGDPATDRERGRFNKIVGELRDAGVDHDEYPMLVKAFVTKMPGASYGVSTVATRVGELRRFIEVGDVQPIDLEALEAQKREQRITARIDKSNETATPGVPAWRRGQA